MPNHVKNVLMFSKLSAKDKEFILNQFCTQSEEEIYPLNCFFDFDKIIPEPKEESECPKDCKVNKDSHVTEDKDRPWFDWYKWRNKYWGTKWGAYDCYTKVGNSIITFVFSTAWSTPYPIYKTLAKNYPFKFEVRYADEDLGNNCGYFNYEPDGVGGGMKLYHTDAKDCCKNPTDFARRLWREY